MGDIFDNIKRIKAFERIFLGFSNNKFIIKDLDKPEEHQTMVFRDNGIIDIHKTTEGSEKKYESLGKFDLAKTMQKILEDPTIFVKVAEEMAKSMKEINFNEPEYADYKIYNIKTKEELSHIAQRKKDDVIIPVESLAEFNFFEGAISWRDAKNKINENALVLDKNNSPIAYLFKKENSVFMMPINIIENQFVSDLISLMNNLEKLDEKTS